MTPKQNGSIWVTVDTRKQKKAIKDRHIPKTSLVVITTQLNNRAVFSKWNFKSEFNQLKLDHGLRCLSFMQDSNI